MNIFRLYLNPRGVVLLSEVRQHLVEEGHRPLRSDEVSLDLTRGTPLVCLGGETPAWAGTGQPVGYGWGQPVSAVWGYPIA